ncbi:MAG TPA: Rieske (2Fe-2S) protein [Kineosporiaceae bacterium]|nr:Rieske (2Fe-2S) protein [Kineosporiaceae bacterium]
MHHDAPTPLAVDTAVATEGPARRGVVALGAAAALGVTGIAASAGCGSSSSGTPTAQTGTASAAGSSGSSGVLIPLAKVPVGGSVLAAGPDGKPIVIAQPEEGKVVAFSAICTHQGCKVIPNGKRLDCPCHGSIFDAFTGAVIHKPAPSPLPSVAVKVSGSNVMAG